MIGTLLTRTLKASLFAITRAFDVAVTVIAATAAAVAGAHAANASVTWGILHTAALGGAIKSVRMAPAGILLLLLPGSAPLMVLPVLLGTSIVSNVLVVAAISNRVLGHGERSFVLAP